MGGEWKGGNTSDGMSVMKEDLTKLKRANDDLRDMIINMEKKWMEREKIFQDALKVKDARVEKVIRLGRGVERKDTPVIVCMNELGAKWEVIKRSKELKELDNPYIKNIFIAPDLTKKESEKQYKLKEELR